MTAILKMLEAAKKATPAPWFQGYWSGQCRKPEHLGNHPGSRRDNPCIYEYSISAGDYFSRYVSAGEKENRVSIVDSGEEVSTIVEDSAFMVASRNATADIQRLVSWVESAEHNSICTKDLDPASHCSCGLDEVLKLIRS